jgi:hypothetical protein
MFIIQWEKVKNFHVHFFNCYSEMRSAADETNERREKSNSSSSRIKAKELYRDDGGEIAMKENTNEKAKATRVMKKFHSYSFQGEKSDEQTTVSRTIQTHLTMK